MTFHKASHAEDGEVKSKKDKKNKTSKDEASIENEEAKPKKKGGLRFLNKLRSNRAEEVPLVEKKDESADEEAKIEDKTEELKDENVDKKSDNIEEVKDNEQEKTDETDDGNKSENQGEVTKSDETGDKEGLTSDDVPAVTITTPGDDNKEGSNDS